MRRYLLAALVVAALVLAAGCGGGSSPQAGATSVGTQSPLATPTDKPLAQPTPPQPAEPIVQVKSGKNLYSPTRDDIEKLGEATITVDGKHYKGVTLATLAAKVSAPAAAQATVLGTNALGTRIAGAVLSLKDDGSSAVFVISADGYLRLAASSLDPSRWLVDVTSIVLS